MWTRLAGTDLMSAVAYLTETAAWAALQWFIHVANRRCYAMT